MTQHKHSHAETGKHAHGGIKKFNYKNLHKDWRTWAVIGLMLVAIAMYVLTLDESVQPVMPKAARGPAAATMPSQR